MLISADWVLPGAGRPIEGGGVLFHGKRLIAVGPAEELRAHPAAEDPIHYEGCVITPGFVNAHAHLSLTALAGVAPPADLPSWLRRLVPAIGLLTADDFAASAGWGALRSLMGGVVAVGDIVYGPEGLAATADSGMGGTFFWEVLGIPDNLLAEELAVREYPLDGRHHCSPRHRCALSAHAIYTCGPRLIQALRHASSEQGVPFAMHVAESAAELDLLLTGGGPLSDTATRLAAGFRAPRTSTVAYLDRLGVLDGMTAVHCVNLTSHDIRSLAAKARGAVVCPLSNDYLKTARAPVAAMMAAGVTLGIGTDSAASNPALDLFEDARALYELHGIAARDIFRMMTVGGATAIGLESQYGTLAEGRVADVVVVETGPTRDPERAVVLEGRPGTIRAVLANGLWRVRHGEPTVDPRPVEEEAARVTRKVRAML